MKYLAFDIEAANGYKHYSICSIGIVIADENFNILFRENIWINPKTKYDLDGTRKNVGINLNLDKALLSASPDFAHSYAKIKQYLCGDYIILGHAVESDCIMLNAACKHYKLPCINFDFICSQLLYRLYKQEKEVKALHKIADQLGISYLQHNSEEDALMSMLTLKYLVEDSGLSVQQLLQKYNVRIGNNKDFVLTRTVSLSENTTKRNITDKAIEALYNYVEQLQITNPADILEGKTVSFARSIELQRIEQTKTLLDALYWLSGKYTPKLSRANIYITADVPRSIDKSREIKVKELQQKGRITVMTQKQLLNLQQQCQLARQTAKEFLTKYNQHADCIDTNEALAAFDEEIKQGLSGQPSSLAMIPSYLSTDIKIKQGVPSLLIDAGGTNFRSCLGCFNQEGKAVLTDVRKSIMPGVKKEATRQEFYDCIAANVKYLLRRAKNVGFCFSYGVDMDDSLDGKAQPFTKEIKASEVAGSIVGKSTLAAINAYDATERKIVILNDTVAALLGGMGVTNTQDFSSYVGYIYGTGTNVCYVEDNANITKLPNLRQGKMIINTEAGNFSRLPRGKFDYNLDAASMRQGQQLAEKMSSGRYVASLFREAVKQAVDDGLLVPIKPLNQEFFAPQYLDTATISRFLCNDKNALQRVTAFFDELSLPLLREIAMQIIDRAAKVGALLVSAFIIKSGGGKDKPVAVVAEGTTFFKQYGFRQRFEGYLTAILQERGLKYALVSGQELNLVGTLVASMVL